MTQGLLVQSKPSGDQDPAENLKPVTDLLARVVGTHTQDDNISGCSQPL